MKRLVPVLAFAALSVAACHKAADHAGQPSAGGDAAPPSQAAGAPSDVNATASADAAGVAPATAQPATPPATPRAPLLAMAYSLGLAIPADQVRPLMESHQEACERAGPDQCQVLAANASADGESKATAQLTVRATPAWMRVFRTRVEADAKDLSGKIVQATTEGDDLTASISGTEAAQRARAAEQARLAVLMHRKTKDVNDSLAVDQQITQVQGDQDQADAQLAAMQGRIALQTLTISYESTAMAAPEGVSAPLAEAAHGFLGNVIGMLAVLLTVASYLLPFGLIAAPFVWWARRSRKAKPTAPATPPSPAANA